MSDLFHEQVPVEYIARVGDAVRRADWHIFQVLTKRHARLHELLSTPGFSSSLASRTNRRVVLAPLVAVTSVW